MNPYQHSDVAVTIYRHLQDSDIDFRIEQMDLGMLACQLAVLISKEYGLELQPPPDDGP